MTTWVLSVIRSDTECMLVCMLVILTVVYSVVRECILVYISDNDYVFYCKGMLGRLPVLTGISHRTNAPNLLPSFTLAPRPLMLAANDWIHWKLRMSHILMIPDWSAVIISGESRTVWHPTKGAWWPVRVCVRERVGEGGWYDVWQVHGRVGGC